MVSKEWSSTAEAAARLQVTRPTVIAWIKDGALRGRRARRGARQEWQVEAVSVSECLTARGGPGARRGRPLGSVTELLEEVRSLQSRVEILEVTAAGATSEIRITEVLSELIELLHMDGTDGAARSRRLAEVTGRLASSLGISAP